MTSETEAQKQSRIFKQQIVNAALADITGLVLQYNLRENQAASSKQKGLKKPSPDT
jgi:hypothetical protein